MKYQLIALLLATLSSPLKAEATLYPFLPTISKTALGKIVLKVECHNSQQQIQSITEWTKKVENRTCLTPKMRVDFNGLCLFEISDCLPKRAAKLHGLSTQEDGPNCWNTSLVFHDVLSHIRQTSIQEYESYLASPMCKKVHQKKQLKPGDIGSIEKTYPDGRKELVHSFIYLNERLVFQKRGFEQFAGFSFSNMTDVLKDYPLKHTGDCKRDCSSQVTFQELLSDQSYNSLLLKFPQLSIPDPKYFCRTFSFDDPNSEKLLSKILKEDIPHLNSEQQSEIESIFYQGCLVFNDKVKIREGVKSFCKSRCPIPQVNYYRCQRPYTFLQRTTPKGARLYKEIQNFIFPLSRSLEEYYLEDKHGMPTLKVQAKVIIKELAKYLETKKVSIKGLTHSEKRALALVGLNLIELCAQINEVDFLKENLSEFYTFASTYSEG